MLTILYWHKISDAKQSQPMQGLHEQPHQADLTLKQSYIFLLLPLPADIDTTEPTHLSAKQVLQ